MSCDDLNSLFCGVIKEDDSDSDVDSLLQGTGLMEEVIGIYDWEESIEMCCGVIGSDPLSKNSTFL